jgi:hypothetical protein
LGMIWWWRKKWYHGRISALLYRRYRKLDRYLLLGVHASAVFLLRCQLGWLILPKGRLSEK